MLLKQTAKGILKLWVVGGEGWCGELSLHPRAEAAMELVHGAFDVPRRIISLMAV
jgi:hypothetical protein